MSLLGYAFRRGRGFWAALFLVGGLGLSEPVAAATLYTYTFEETDFSTIGTSGGTGKLSGGFTGSLNSFGTISLGDLTDFHLEFSGFDIVPLNGNYPAHLSFFDYRPGDDSTFGFIALIGNPHVSPPLHACVGFPVGFSCGGGSYRGYLSGSVSGFAGSNSAPDLTLVATTPIPAGLPLFATALLGLGVLAGRRPRARTAAMSFA